MVTSKVPEWGYGSHAEAVEAADQRARVTGLRHAVKKRFGYWGVWELHY